MNFNTVYFEPRTYQIAAWIQIKMYFITILFLSVFHPSPCEYFSLRESVLSNKSCHIDEAHLAERFSQQNKHRRLEKHQLVKHYKFSPFSPPAWFAPDDKWDVFLKLCLWHQELLGNELLDEALEPLVRCKKNLAAAIFSWECTYILCLPFLLCNDHFLTLKNSSNCQMYYSFLIQ